jgi:hypothetical protein
MAIPNPRGCWQRRKASRLRKRIAALESDRMRLMAYLLHFKKGKGDPKYLNRRRRRALRRTPSGVLLESIEKESRRLRDQLAELKAGES